ncbi:MAG: fructose-6-phosphate aldolase [Alphaproteobacteria bacterium]|nr:fructose-6-phosphate aldolase [Alphaproteobacteria bacterium]
MKFFIDTADLNEIRELNQTRLVDGVTTNPSLIAQSGQKIAKVIEQICAIVTGPVSAEVTAIDFENMLKEGRYLAKIASNVTVKVPLTVDGLKACRTLSREGTMVNVTLCFSAAQALMAAKAGATFISPFVGRLDDLSQNGMELIEDICDIYANYPRFETEVLVASIRHPLHVIQAARIGADVATIPPKVLRQMYDHPLTKTGLEAFLADWAKTGETILESI